MRKDCFNLRVFSGLFRQLFYSQVKGNRHSTAFNIRTLDKVGDWWDSLTSSPFHAFVAEGNSCLAINLHFYLWDYMSKENHIIYWFNSVWLLYFTSSKTCHILHNIIGRGEQPQVVKYLSHILKCQRAWDVWDNGYISSISIHVFFVLSIVY